MYYYSFIFCSNTNEYEFSVSSDVYLGPNLRPLRKSQCPSYSQKQKLLKMIKVSLKSNKPVCIAYSSCVQCRDWSLLQGTSSALRVRITFDILCEIYLELFSFQKYCGIYCSVLLACGTQVNTQCYNQLWENLLCLVLFELFWNSSKLQSRIQGWWGGNFLIIKLCRVTLVKSILDWCIQWFTQFNQAGWNDLTVVLSVLWLLLLVHPAEYNVVRRKPEVPYIFLFV